MSLYPTEDGFKDERQEPDEWGKEEQYPEYSPCNDYDDDLICPCCGGEVKILGGNYTGEPMTPHCFACGWTGDTEYD